MLAGGRVSNLVCLTYEDDDPADGWRENETHFPGALLSELQQVPKYQNGFQPETNKQIWGRWDDSWNSKLIYLHSCIALLIDFLKVRITQNLFQPVASLFFHLLLDQRLRRVCHRQRPGGVSDIGNLEDESTENCSETGELDCKQANQFNSYQHIGVYGEAMTNIERN